jgi:hypothetical protein
MVTVIKSDLEIQTFVIEKIFLKHMFHNVYTCVIIHLTSYTPDILRNYIASELDNLKCYISHEINLFLSILPLYVPCVTKYYDVRKQAACNTVSV